MISLLRWLQKLFRKVEIYYLPLVFRMDFDSSGKHIVRVFLKTSQGEKLVKNVSLLGKPGYRVDYDRQDRHIIFRVKEEDRQIIQALMSLDPVIGDDGSLIVSMTPAILNYLRRKGIVQETEAAQGITIEENPLRPVIQMHFDQEDGLEVKTGFRAKNHDHLMDFESLDLRQDGSYFFDGQVFQRLPELSTIAKDFLRTYERKIPIEQVVDFSREQFPRVAAEFDQQVSSEQFFEISDTVLIPEVKIAYEPHRGVTVETGFQVEPGGTLIPWSRLKKSGDNRYVLLGNTFHRLPDLSEEAFLFLKNSRASIPIDGVPEFFQRDLVLLLKEFKAVLLDRLDEIHVIDCEFTPFIKIDVEGPGWLEFQLEYEAAGFRFSYEETFSKGRGGYVRIGESTWVKIDRNVYEQSKRWLSRSKSEKTEQGFRIPITEFATLEEFVQSIGGQAVLSQEYQDFLSQLTGFKADERFRLPEKIEAALQESGITLRPYQRAGIHWMSWLGRHALHGLLADDMGLGKTMQTLCVLGMGYETTGSRQHSLIIAPASVLLHWEREIKRCYPYIQVEVYHGAKRNRSIWNSQKPHVVISTYDIVRREIDHLGRIPFFYLILDEATKIKTPVTRRTKAIKAINAAHRLALTGTPVENRPLELWSVFDFLLRGHLGDYETFQRVFEEPILQGNQQAVAKLGRRVKPFMLRRKKEDVAKDLPEKIVMMEWCELTDEQRKLYQAAQDGANRLRHELMEKKGIILPIDILPIITKLKQICDHPAIVLKEEEPLYKRSNKFDWIIEKIQEIVESGEQVVVFSHFLGMLDLIQRAIQERSYSFIRIDGSVSGRQKLIDLFNQGKKRVAILSVNAAGHGINLTAANHVIHADRWWNPAVEDQATDRVHRIGQDRTVYVYYILVQYTLEERICRLLEKKRQISDQIIVASQEGGRQWSPEELLEILKPFPELSAS